MIIMGGNTMRKKLLSILLSFAMCLSFIPTQVFAEVETRDGSYELSRNLNSLITKAQLFLTA